MPIPLKCACGKSLSAPDALAGKRVKCPGCGGVLTVPAAGAKPAPKPPAPAKTPPAPPKPSPPPPKASGSGLTTAVSIRAPAAKAPAGGGATELHNYASCPVCGSFVSKKDAICVACGLNLVTGKKLATKKSSEPTGPPRNMAITCLVLNIAPVPGVGTLIGGRRSERTKGIIQVGVYLAGLTAVNPWYPNLPHILNASAAGTGLVATLGGLVLIVVSVIWSAMTGMAILNNAQPE